MRKLNLFLPVLATIFMVAILTNCKNRELKIEDNINEQHETDVQELVSAVEQLREENRHIEAMMLLMPDSAQMWEDLRIIKAENDVAIEEYMMELTNKGLTAEQESLLEYLQAKYDADKYSLDIVQQLIIDAYKRTQAVMVDTMTFKADLDAFTAAFTDAQNMRSMYTIAVSVPGAGYEDLKVSDIDGLTATLTQNGMSYDGTVDGNSIMFDNLRPGPAMVTVSATDHLEVMYDIDLPQTGNMVSVTIPNVNGGGGSTTFDVEAYPVSTVSQVNLVSTAETVTFTGEIRRNPGYTYCADEDGANIPGHTPIDQSPADLETATDNQKDRDAAMKNTREFVVFDHYGDNDNQIVLHFSSYPGSSDILPSVKSTDAAGNDVSGGEFDTYAKIAKVSDIIIKTSKDDGQTGIFTVEVPVLTSDFIHQIDLVAPIYMDIANRVVAENDDSGLAVVLDYNPAYGGNALHHYLKNEPHETITFGKYVAAIEKIHVGATYPTVPFVDNADFPKEGNINTLFDEEDRAEAAGATVNFDILIAP